MHACRRKGQGATEYLVVLGAVLLVSIIVVSIASFPTSQATSIKKEQSETYWSSLSPLRITSSKVVDANLVLAVQNPGTAPVRLDGIRIDGIDLPIYPYYSGDYYGQSYCSRPNDNTLAAMTCSLILAAGQVTYVAVQGAGVIDCMGKAEIEIQNVMLVYSPGDSSITNIALRGDKPIISSCSIRTCTEGWVKVPGNISLLVNDFCMMKYEAKNNGSNFAVSNWSGTPWVDINQTYAADRCSALGAGYHLISDREMNAVSSNAANTASNWFNATAGNSTGSPCLFGGHAECDSTQCNAAFNASSDDAAGWWNGITNASVSSTATCPFAADEARGFETRRTMYLSNGQVVWDLSGNVNEWTSGTLFENKTASGGNLYDDSDGITGGQMPFLTGATTAGWYELTAITNFNSLNYSYSREAPG